MLSSIKNFFKAFGFKDWLLVIMAVLSVVVLIECKYWKAKSFEYYNQKALYADTLTTYKNALGEEYKSKYTMSLSIDDLKKQNKDLYAEVKNLKDNPIVVTKTSIKTEVRDIDTRIDTVYLRTSLDDRGGQVEEHVIEWSAEDSIWYALQGKTSVASDFSNFKTKVAKMTINSDIKLHLIDNGEEFRVVAKTDNPYIDITGIESVVVDPKKSKLLKKYFPQKKWGLGPHIGVGLDSELKLKPYIGIGLQYNILSF